MDGFSARHPAARLGEPTRRREDDALLRGQGAFVDDLRPDGCLFLSFARSPYASGRIASVDVAAARSAPEARLVLTAEDLDGLGQAAVNPLTPNLKASPAPLLAHERVLHVGQPIAAVVAATRAAAIALSEEIAVDVTDEAQERPEAFREAWAWGDADAAMASADHVVEVVVQHARVAPMALEPRATLAIWNGAESELTVWLQTQSPHRARSDLARILGLDPAQIRVIAPHVGGAFGGKASVYPEDAVTALAAMRTGRPVSWTATRNEEFLSATHGRGGEMRGRLGLTAAGRLVALEAEARFGLGAWMPFSAVVPARNAGRILPGPYDVPHVRVSAVGAPTNHAPVGIYRGAGRPEATMLMERLMDAAAQRLAMNPIALRSLNARNRRSLVRPTTTGGPLMDACDFKGLLKTLRLRMREEGFERKRTRIRRRGGLAGVGVALYVEPCGQGWESATLSLDVHGHMRLATGSTAQGQGRETAAAQIAADALGRRAQDVSVAHGDTRTTPEGIGALASRSTPIGGSAIVKVARSFMTKARALAARILQTSADKIHADADGFHVAGTTATLSWAELGKAAHEADARDPGLAVASRYEAKGEAWASGAVGALVTIDPDTGAPRVEQVIWIDDAGVVVNPMLVEGQLVGGLAQGLGEALMERIVYDDNDQLQTGTLMDYQVPRAADMPPVEIVKKPTRSRMNLIGAKGAGEAGCIGVPAAIANAIHDALAPAGVAHIDMPFTAQTIWSALRAAKTPEGEPR